MALSSDLNLTPMIDMMATLTSALLLLSSWGAFTGLSAEQSVCADCDVKDPEAQLTVHVHAGGVEVGYATFSEVGAAGLDNALATARAANPTQHDWVLSVDDGVPYADAIGAWGTASAHGYGPPRLAGQSP